MGQFEDYSFLYDAFYADKNYKKETKDVDIILKKHGQNIKDIIVFGCGTGNHDSELVELGYQCHGIDLSEKMIQVAKEKSKIRGISNTYQVADIRTYSSDIKYDAVIALFHVISYQTTNSDVIDALKSARGVVKKGGILLFDVWYGPGVLRELPEVRIKEAEDKDKKMIRFCKPVMYENENRVDVQYKFYVMNNNTEKVKIFNETHRMRYFFKPEIQEYLRENVAC